jgi:hypothetical protein
MVAWRPKTIMRLETTARGDLAPPGRDVVVAYAARCRSLFGGAPSIGGCDRH